MESKEAEFKLVYWAGNFAGRGEFVRMLLDVGGAKWVDICRDAGSSARAMQHLQGKVEGAFPVLFPPILEHNGTTFNQLPAIVLYLGQVLKLAPTTPVDLAHAMQISLTALDAVTEACAAFHPTNYHASYASQKEAAEPVIVKWLAERLPKFLGVLERQLAANGEGKGFFIGDTLTFVDLVVFNFVRGWRTSRPAHFESCADAPLLKAHAERIAVLPRVAAFLKSDRCTKMESETASPVAEAPAVQVNSFM